MQWKDYVFGHSVLVINHTAIWRVKLRNIPLTILYLLVIPFVTTTMTSLVSAEEKIIQQEEISFDKCLKVITTSQDKLSIEPVIKNISDQKRAAVFKLVDGTLTISCDGIEGIVTVVTNTN